MDKRLIVALAATTTLAACEDVGLEDRNLEFEAARDRAPSALVMAVHPTSAAAAHVVAGAETTAPVAGAGELGAEMRRPVAISGRVYIPSGRPQDVAPDMMRPVGSFGGQAFSALSWDEPPYDRLYTMDRRTGDWFELQVVPAGGPFREPDWATAEPHHLPPEALGHGPADDHGEDAGHGAGGEQVEEVPQGEPEGH